MGGVLRSLDRCIMSYDGGYILTATFISDISEEFMNTMEPLLITPFLLPS